MFGEQRDTTVQKQRPQWNMELWLCHSGDAPLRLEHGMFWSLGKALTEGKTTLLLHLKKIKNLVFVSLQDVQQWLNSTSKKYFFHINKSTIWINDILNRCETHHDSLIHLYSLKLVKLLSYWIPFNHCKKNMKKSYIWTLTKCSSPNTPPCSLFFRSSADVSEPLLSGLCWHFQLHCGSTASAAAYLPQELTSFRHC